MEKEAAIPPIQLYIETIAPNRVKKESAEALDNI